MRAMRALAFVFESLNATFAVFAQAFMCSRMRFLSAMDSPSRNFTPSFTPPVCQYLVVRTAMRSALGMKPGTTRTRRSMGGWLTGLMSAAVFAASSHFAFGRTLGRQTRVGSKRGFGLDFVMAAPPSFPVVYADQPRSGTTGTGRI